MKKIVGFIIILLIGVQFLFSGIISAKDAAKLSKKGDAVIVSARPAKDYGKKHIKDAVHINHADLYKAEGIKSMLKSSEEIAKVFGETVLLPIKK